MQQGSSYRADIDGLRAVAVLSVILFHLHVPGFSGGYVGVDIFFVISGYLITGFIQTELDANAFSLRAFYLRRLRRLGPALLIVSIPVAVAAWVLLYPEDMRSFAASLALQFVALQNVFFLADGEYFRGSDTKPLLHTWTLAVEEQFYLLWPLLLLLTRRLRFARRLALVALILTVSFALNLVLLKISPKASFFLLPPRAWELGIGGAVALVQRQGLVERHSTAALRGAAGVLGLLAILVSVAVLNATTPFPGWAALGPVLGAALLVVAGIGGSHPVGRALARPAMVHIGLLSYSMYLWHWPLIAFAHVAHHDPTRPVDAILLLGVSFGLAELTYRFVETPTRTRRWLSTSRSLLWVSGSTALVLAAFGLQSYLADGAAYRFPPLARAFLTAPFHARSERCGQIFRALHPRSQVCALHGEARPEQRVLLWGNSHADMWSGLFVNLASKHHASLYLNARNCRATPDVDFCGPQVQAAVLQFIASEHVTDVVLASSWYGAYDVPDPVFERTLGEVVAKVSALGSRTWLVLDTPTGKPLDPLVAFEKNPSSPSVGSIPLSDYLSQKGRELALFARLARDNANVRVIDLSGSFCDDRVCSAGRDGVVWYRDTGHVTDDGAAAARAPFAVVFER